MILSLLLAGPEEADDPVGTKGVSRSPQAPCRQTCFLCPFCCWHTEQYDRTNPFVQALFWCSTRLLERMIVVCSLLSFSLRLWHGCASVLDLQRRSNEGGGLRARWCLWFACGKAWC